MNTFRFLLGVVFSVALLGCGNEPPFDPLAPKACFEIADAVLYAKMSISFNAECSANALYYAWDFGDGGYATSSSPTHTYTQAGSFTVTLRIEDANAVVNVTTKQITVQPSPFIEHSGYIDVAEVWAEGKHLVTSTVTIRHGSLTIQPGAEIYFNKEKSIRIGHEQTTTPGGALFSAVGTAAKPIQFKPASGLAVAGEWGHLFFAETASSASKLEHCKLMYGGKANSWFDYELGTYFDRYGMIDILNAGVKIVNTEIKGAANFGIGCREEGYFTQFDNNTLKENTSYPIHISINQAHTIGTGNVIQSVKGIYLHTEYFEQLQATWRKQDVPYVFEREKILGSGNVGIETLTLEPGVTIALMKGASLMVGKWHEARIVAEGTASNPILFTSAEATKAPGDWMTIDASWGSVFRHCRFEYGGGNTFNNYSNSLNIGSRDVMTNCTIIDGKGDGLVLSGLPTEFENNTISTCSKYGIRIPAANLHQLSTSNTVANNMGVLLETGIEPLPAGNIVWEKRPYTLTLSGTLGVYNADGPVTLTFAPGLVLNLTYGAQIFVSSSYNGPDQLIGTLIADGTTERIVIKPTAGALANGENWGYISFASNTTSDSRLINCDLLNGGYTQDNWLGVIDCKATVNKPTISGCKISNTYNHAISLDNNATPVLSNNTFENVAGEIMHNY